MMRKIMHKGLSDIINARNTKHWLEDALDKFLTKIEKEDRSGDSFHPSSAGKCPRSIQLSMNGLMPDNIIEPKVQRIFDNGHAMHFRYSKYFEKMGLLEKNEAEVFFESDGVVIKGHADDIIKDSFGVLHLMELKSINSRRFNELWLENRPLEENFLQWNVYSHCLDIPIGEILYENKDDQMLKIFSVKYDPFKFNEQFEIFKMIHKYNEEGLIIPAPKCDNKYCPAKDICKEIEKKEKIK
jgi:hypothetical protein